MTDSALILRIVIRWFLVLLSCSAVVCVFWSFAGAFVKEKRAKVIIVTLLTAFCIYLYVERHTYPKTVRMKEDTLYIKPISE